MVLVERPHDSDTSSSVDAVLDIQRFCKSMLKNTLFVGTFHEKRRVESLNTYRNVIKLADSEANVIENLLVVKNRCAREYPNIWIGITSPSTPGAPAGYNIWAAMEQEVLGTYWYRVKTVHFSAHEIYLKLEVIRPLSKENTPTRTVYNQSDHVSFSDHINELKSQMNAFCSHVFTDVITVNNTKNTAIFIILFISTVVTFLVHAIKYLMEYLLKVLRELSVIIKACTPITMGFFKLILNIVNGFYHLIFSLNRPKVQQIQPNHYAAIRYPHPNDRYKALIYPQETYYKSSVVITEVES